MKFYKPNFYYLCLYLITLYCHLLDILKTQDMKKWVEGFYQTTEVYSLT